MAGGDYAPFEGICLTDTFQMYEKDDLISEQLVENSERRKRQKALDIRVIIGNPPYSIGQGSQNDNNQNIEYASLDARIAETYAEQSAAALSKGLYDSYIRAIRWASDRVGESGIIGFVTNAGFLEANSADGLRKCLAEEFSSIYIFHLRGNARTQGELRRKEKDNIFESGSRAPIAVSLLVKNPQASQHGKIYFHDIGDYLTREQKLEKVAGFQSVAGITADNGWQTITPDNHGDWLNQRDNSFNSHIVLGNKNKKSTEARLFNNFSNGVVTSRDAWCYNSSQRTLAANMSNMIGFYNSEVERFNNANPDLNTKIRATLVDDFVNTDPTKISWSVNIKQDLARSKQFQYNPACITQSIYRPFTKQYLYFNRNFNERVLQMPRIFPEGDKTENLVIGISGNGAKQFTTLISNALPDIQVQFNGQWFPLYLYEKSADSTVKAGDSHNLLLPPPPHSLNLSPIPKQPTGLYSHRWH